MIKAEERKEKSNKKLKAMGITINETLPVIKDSSQVKLKSLDEICQRAIASLVATQLALDARQNEYEESAKFFKPILEQYGVADCLNQLERKIFAGDYVKQDLIDASWQYECYWALVWALGLVDDISDATRLCDGETAVSLVQTCESFSEFKQKCQLRDVEEILDMLDLYYRYHWAAYDKMVNQTAKSGNLNFSVVYERRRGLEWLVSEIDDWHDISLDT